MLLHNSQDYNPPLEPNFLLIRVIPPEDIILTTAHHNSHDVVVRFADASQ